MIDNLVIVESPAKAKTIENFLGKDYIVKSSFGHIRDLKQKEFSIDIENDFTPKYVVPAEKKKLVSELKSLASEAKMVWLASDEDREGEAIAWHLFDALGLKKEKTQRIVFHEITKDAIVNAIKNPRSIDEHLVNAQQARRVLDRIVGFELSPVLWRKVKPALSAGRVQSVAVKLIVEREREIENFKSEASFRVVGIFEVITTDGRNAQLKAELNNRFSTEGEAESFLQSCIAKEYIISDISKKPGKRTPPPPFTTSTLQQEASRKLSFSVAQTMSIAQRLYESGKITYMRTDSVNLSGLALQTAKSEIEKNYGNEYSKTRKFSTSSKGAQEAHEAIRPTYISAQEIEGTRQEQKLYDLIWKRTVASQMADAKTEKTVITIEGAGTKYNFVASGEVIVFDGFLKLYMEAVDDDETENNDEALLPPVTKGQQLELISATATERFTLKPFRYNEATLVRKLEELGIGRPSTYAPTISTIQNREYVVKESRLGEKRNFIELTLKGDKLTRKEKSETFGAEKNKLFPTDIGRVVNDFLQENFESIMDYNFTANVEKEFDMIAEGNMEWTTLMKEFYSGFHPLVTETSEARTEKKVGERLLGTDPATGRPVSVKIGRFGPMVQVGSKDDEEKPQFASLSKNQSINTITLQEALELFKLPRTVGEYNGEIIQANIGRFGPYVRFGKLFVSLPKEEDPMSVSIETAIELIEAKIKAEKEKVIQVFERYKELQVLNGRYGPYIAHKGSNYKIPKGKDAALLTFEECMAIIDKGPASGGAKKRGKK